jgi:hypothetical protein
MAQEGAEEAQVTEGHDNAQRQVQAQGQEAGFAKEEVIISVVYNKQ